MMLKTQYISYKNLLHDSTCIYNSLLLLQETYPVITYDNLNDVNKFMSKDNVMIPLLEHGFQQTKDLINQYKDKIELYSSKLEEIKLQIPEKYHNCNFYVEVLFS